MSEKDLKGVQNYITISKMAIKYLQENKKNMVEQAIEKIKEDSIIAFQLEENNNLKSFKDSILDDESGHIVWIEKDIYRPKQIPFAKYNKKTLKSLTPVYCEFYKEMVNISNTIGEKSIRKALIGYFDGFIRASC